MSDPILPPPPPNPDDFDFVLNGEEKLALGDYLLSKNKGMERPPIRFFIAHLYKMITDPSQDKLAKQTKLAALKVFASVFFNTNPDPEQNKKAFKFEVEGIQKTVSGMARMPKKREK